MQYVAETNYKTPKSYIIKLDKPIVKNGKKNWFVCAQNDKNGAVVVGEPIKFMAYASFGIKNNQIPLQVQKNVLGFLHYSSLDLQNDEPLFLFS